MFLFHPLDAPDLLPADVVVSHDGNHSIVDTSAFFYVDTTIFSVFKEDKRPRRILSDITEGGMWMNM